MIGRDALLRLGSSTVVCFRSLNFSFDANPLDASDSCSVYRLYSEGVSQRNADVTVEGIAKTEFLRNRVLNGQLTLAGAELVFADGASLIGTAVISAYSESYTYNDLTTFSGTLQFTREYVYAPADPSSSSDLPSSEPVISSSEELPFYVAVTGTSILDENTLIWFDSSVTFPAVGTDESTILEPRAILRDGDRLYIAGYDIERWTLEGTLAEIYPTTYSIEDLARSGTTLAMSFINDFSDNPCVRFVDADWSTLPVTDPVPPAPEEGSAVAFNPAGTHVAFTCQPVFDGGSGEYERVQIYQTSDYSKIATVQHPANNNANAVHSLLYSEDGANLWVGAGAGRLRRFDTATYTQQASVIPENWIVHSMAEKGDYLILGVRVPSVMQGIRVVDKLTLAPVTALGFSDANLAIYRVEFNSDKSRLLVTGTTLDFGASVFWIFDSSDSDPDNWTIVNNLSVSTAYGTWGTFVN